MKKAIIDLNTNAIVGLANDGAAPEKHQVLLDLPEDFNPDEVAEWAYDGQGLTRDTVALLERSKAARKARIKSEAARLISALDWRLERARERAEGAISGMETVADVLAMREAIRRSSSEAEAAMESLTDVGSVQTFTWSVTTSKG